MATTTKVKTLTRKAQDQLQEKWALARHISVTTGIHAREAERFLAKHSYTLSSDDSHAAFDHAIAKLNPPLHALIQNMKSDELFSLHTDELEEAFLFGVAVGRRIR